jgi:ribosomal protein L11 methylase PrmA
MKDDAILLASGIITERAEEVIEALNASHLKVVRRLDDNGWCALVVQKA